MVGTSNLGSWNGHWKNSQLWASPGMITIPSPKRLTGAEESQASQLRDQAEQLQAGAQSMEHQVEARHGRAQLGTGSLMTLMWGCIKTNLAIFGGMNIHLPVIWGSLGYQGFDSYPCLKVKRSVFGSRNCGQGKNEYLSGEAVASMKKLQ